MTVDEAINFVDEVKPNSFSMRIKVMWLSSLEGRIGANVFLMAPAEVENLKFSLSDENFKRERELIVKPPHDDIYIFWLEAQIDYHNGEYNKYQSSMAMYNAALGDLKRWVAINYNPCGGEPSGLPQYYISAYGLAVQQGFNGSLDEWLKSLEAKSAYEIATQNGFMGDEKAWLESLHGAIGPRGPQGIQGEIGPEGPRGEGGIMVPNNGFFHLCVKENGDLVAITADGSQPPPLLLRTNGDLVYTL